MSTTEIKGHVVKASYDLLVASVKTAANADDKLAKAKRTREGAYSKMLAAGREVDNLADWEATYKAFCADQVLNHNGLADMAKAEKRKEIGPNGETHKVAASVKTVGSLITYCLTNEVSWVDPDTGKFRSYSELHKIRRELRAAAAEEEARRRAEEAGGDERVRFEIRDTWTQIAERLGNATSNDLNEIYEMLKGVLNNLPEKVEEDTEEDADTDETVGEALSEVA